MLWLNSSNQFFFVGSYMTTIWINSFTIGMLVFHTAALITVLLIMTCVNPFGPKWPLASNTWSAWSVQIQLTCPFMLVNLIVYSSVFMRFATWLWRLFWWLNVCVHVHVFLLCFSQYSSIEHLVTWQDDLAGKPTLGEALYFHFVIVVAAVSQSCCMVWNIQLQLLLKCLMCWTFTLDHAANLVWVPLLPRYESLVMSGWASNPNYSHALEKYNVGTSKPW